MVNIQTATLQEHFNSCSDFRPIVTSLNAHNSWLLSFPRPWDDQKQSGRAYYHVVLDPWLVGPASLVGSWFVHVDLPTTPALPTPAAVEDAARRIEALASEFVLRRRMSNEVFNSAGYIDAILLDFHYYDHVHEATLREFDGNIPVIATTQAAKILKPWTHFANVSILPDFQPRAASWRDPNLYPKSLLPGWLTVLRFPGHRDMNFGIAIIWSHAGCDGKEAHEMVLNSPHGILLDHSPLQAFLEIEPKIQPLAMLHGLKESHTGGKQTSLGAKGGLALYRNLGDVRYWVLANHLLLNYTGVFMRLSRTADTARTLEWALDEEQRRLNAKPSSEKIRTKAKPHVVQVTNGECFVLEV